MNDYKDWLQAELQETLDEDIELEMEDAALSAEIRRIYRSHHPDRWTASCISANCCAFNPN